MQHLIDFLAANSVVILGALLAVSELLSLIPSVKANGVFQLVTNWLKGKIKSSNPNGPRD